MSRYVHVTVSLTRDELLSALVDVGLTPQVGGTPGAQVMLDGSFECAGEPVDIRLPEGTRGAVEDFGFRVSTQGVTLVCGDVDRRQLDRDLLKPIQATVAAQRVHAAARREGLVTEEVLEADGTRRIVVRRG